MSDSASETRDFLGQKLKSGSFFSFPGLFIGFNTKGSSDSDSFRSPTSPLDYKVFANLANPFMSPRASPNGPQKVGIAVRSALSKSILFGSQFRNPSSPKHLFDSVDSSLPKVHAVSSNSQLDSPCLQLDNSENVFGVRETRLELSEDYTCVISHGPNPRKTHIFGDCILECHGSELTFSKKEERVMELSPKVKCLNGSVLYPSDDFLSCCCACKKKLEQGKDSYMYRFVQYLCFLILYLLLILLIMAIDIRMIILNLVWFEYEFYRINLRWKRIGGK
ncbi:FCS-Like Zinc finger 8-like [Telopea speciosissima]|uniref:FCS-Like Zinc finger 8-like n=1 Tax=Telopea speciosissima TaxID=54955 RepID=UPI001CC468A2|nr:FCS-Like Zinc finger 8-like [Telopea speciosissima]